jgi:asparagine synthase (glutamine-hydrolysing)
VVALMQAQTSRPVKTFSIGFQERGYDESLHAAAVARHLGTEHTDLYVTDTDARAVIPQLPDIYDEPFADPSQIPTFLVSKLAREHVTVALSGDGGDELFAGYNRYVFVARFWQRLQLLPSPLRRLAARALSSPSPAAWDAFYERAALFLPRHFIPALPGQKMHKIASILPSPSLLALHARLVAQWANPKTVLNPRWYHDGLLWQDQLGQDDALLAPEQQMVWDTQTYLVDDILTKVDRASMRVGLEARVPLLDHNMVEFAWRIPMSMKLKDGTGKWLLKQLLYRHVPQALVDRPKMGFSVPIDAWLRGSLREWAQTYLAEDRIIAEGFFDARVVRQTWEQHLKGAIDAGGPLWTLLMFQLWLEKVKKWV